MDNIDPVLAFQRFGLGARPGDLEWIGTDGHSALVAEIDTPGIALLEADELPHSSSALATIVDARKERRRSKRSAANADAETADAELGDSAEMNGADAESGNMSDDVETADTGKSGKKRDRPQYRIFRDEVAARIRRALDAEIGFAERWVTFWNNHFAVKGTGSLQGVVGAYEREAIRPHAFGRFEDILLAATRHPVMLRYLDNGRSIGPNSPVGLRREKGLNENHAREILELHTLGVDADYTQADVTALAKVLTGWTTETGRRRPENFRQFVFDKRRHEPGDHTVMGITYPEGGVEQGEAVLHDLAVHPATARHIARKLARHFVADDPPEALVDHLDAEFRRTEGDLKAVAKALVLSDDAWGPPTKLKTPQEFLWSSLRALDLELRSQLAIRSLKTLGQPIWEPASPEGFSDETATWLAPDALTNRLDIVQEMVQRAPGNDDPSELLIGVLGPNVSQETQAAVRRAESREQGLALMLMSAEFQRR